MDKATPRPWKQDSTNLIVKDHKTIAWVNAGDREEMKANAELIVKAVNCHEELVFWCEWLLDNIQSSKVVQNGEDEKIEAVLKKAKAAK